MEDDTGGDTRLVLRCPVQIRVDVIELKDPNCNERSNMPVEAAADSAGPRGLRPQAKATWTGECHDWTSDRDCILRFPGKAEQRMCERRNLKGERHLRTKKISVFARSSAIEFAVSSIEFRDAPEKGQEFVLSGELPAVEVGLLCNH